MDTSLVFRMLCSMAFAVALLVAPAASHAAGATSQYTKIDLSKCAQVAPAKEEGTFGGGWSCAGLKGIPVTVAEGDLRMFVSFGPGAAEEPAAIQTLPNFNTINDTLEWRLRGGIPFATILRWFPSLDEGSKTGSVLIVTQLAPGAVCHVARIDAQVNRNANVLAREAADRLAGDYDCTLGPQIIGAPGVLN